MYSYTRCLFRNFSKHNFTDDMSFDDKRIALQQLVPHIWDLPKQLKNIDLHALLGTNGRVDTVIWFFFWRINISVDKLFGVGIESRFFSFSAARDHLRQINKFNIDFRKFNYDMLSLIRCFIWLCKTYPVFFFLYLHYIFLFLIFILYCCYIFFYVPLFFL